MRSSVRKLIKWTAIIYTAAVLLIVSAGAQNPVAKEYQIKAVFLFNFTQFVEWPAVAFASADAPLVIGVVGEDPFGPYLDAAVKGEFVDSHPIIVERYGSVDEIGECHILFIGLKNKEQVRVVLEQAGARHILTVGDEINFAKAGGMVGFYNEAGRIRFRINVGEVEDAQLVISSKLLRLADIVSSKN